MPFLCPYCPGWQRCTDVTTLCMQGKTFTEATVPKTNATWMIENAIARYTSPDNGTDMHMQLFRTRTGTTLQSWSADEGKTWSFPQNSTLPNPNSRVSTLSRRTTRLCAFMILYHP